MIFTTAIRKIAAMKHKTKVVQGSQGGGKTGGILRRWVLKALRSDETQFCSIVTDTFPNLESGAIKDFLEICEQENITYSGTKKPAVYHINKWTFQFFSVDKVGKAIGARRDRLYINEGNRISWDIARQLINRTHVERIIDFNPTRKFWAHEQYVDVDDCAFIKLTYKDNEMLPESEKEDIERTAPWGKVPDANFWRVYGLGELGFVEGVIFKNYKTFKELPSAKYKKMVGIDFGWEDPMTAMMVHVDQRNRRIFWRELFYASHASHSDVVASIKNDKQARGCVVVCDNSAPREIMKLRKKGLKAIGCDKTAGLPAELRALKQYEIFIHEDSENAKAEADGYKWLYKNGSFIDYPDQLCDHHAIDGGRYPSTIMINN